MQALIKPAAIVVLSDLISNLTLTPQLTLDLTWTCLVIWKSLD